MRIQRCGQEDTRVNNQAGERGCDKIESEQKENTENEKMENSTIICQWPSLVQRRPRAGIHSTFNLGTSMAVLGME